MRRFSMILVGCMMVLWAANSAMAQLPAGVMPPGGSSQIGVTAAVKGTVKIATGSSVGQVVESGRPIFLGDVVSTDAQSHLQILLLDETVFTIGPNSSMVIDRFVYDPATSTGKVGARVLKGIFRFVTGKIAKKNPKDMEVKLPSGTIGIRGTIVAGRVEGDSSRIVLLGPGPANNTDEPPGQIVVSNVVEGVTHEVTVTRPSFGTEIGGVNEIPTPPIQIPAAQLEALTASLEPSLPAVSESPPPPPPGGEAGVSPSEQAGQRTAEGLKSLIHMRGLADVAQFLAKDQKQAAQDTVTQINRVADGITTREQLRQIQTGIFHYSFVGLPGSFVQTVKNGSPVNIQGTATAHFNIDFGARLLGPNIGANTSRYILDTLANGGDIHFEGHPGDSPISFATGTGNLTLHFSSGDVSDSGELRNLNGLVAGQALFSATFDNTGTVGFSSRDVGSTNGNLVMNRESGATPPP